MTTTIDEATDGHAHVLSPRRYRLLKRLRAFETALPELGSTWRAKQEATPATPLPATFPALVKLAAAGYTAVEDVRGADSDELQQPAPYAALTRPEADAVIAAIAAIT